MRIKPYDERLGKYGKEAEVVVAKWLRAIGYTAGGSADKYGPDVKFEAPDRTEEPFTVEVERCEERRWTNGKFPFSTVSVIERRWKYFRTGLNMVVCSDMTQAWIVYRSAAAAAYKADRVETFNNRMMKNERRLLVPIRDCKLFDLEDKTPRSIDRMRAGNLFNL